MFFKVAIGGMLTPVFAVLCRLVRAMYKFDKSQMFFKVAIGNDSRFPNIKKSSNVAHFFMLQIFLPKLKQPATRAAPQALPAKPCNPKKKILLH